MSVGTFIHFTLSVYAVFFIADALKAYKDAKHYQFKYFGNVHTHQRFVPLFLSNHKWSIVGIVCLMSWVWLITWMVG